MKQLIVCLLFTTLFSCVQNKEEESHNVGFNSTVMLGKKLANHPIPVEIILPTKASGVQKDSVFVIASKQWVLDTLPISGGKVKFGDNSYKIEDFAKYVAAYKTRMPKWESKLTANPNLWNLDEKAMQSTIREDLFPDKAITPQGEVFCCSNHSPSHCVNSSDVQNYVRDKKCSGFK